VVKKFSSEEHEEKLIGMSSDICLLPEEKNEIVNIQKQRGHTFQTFHDCHPDYGYISICVELKIKDQHCWEKGTPGLHVCDIFLSLLKKIPCKLRDCLRSVGLAFFLSSPRILLGQVVYAPWMGSNTAGPNHRCLDLSEPHSRAPSKL
jgi:hypothetical protein